MVFGQQYLWNEIFINVFFIKTLEKTDGTVL